MCTQSETAVTEYQEQYDGTWTFHFGLHIKHEVLFVGTFNLLVCIEVDRSDELSLKGRIIVFKKALGRIIRGKERMLQPFLQLTPSPPSFSALYFFRYTYHVSPYVLPLVHEGWDVWSVVRCLQTHWQANCSAQLQWGPIALVLFLSCI